MRSSAICVVAVCAKLPYYITSPILMRLLETEGLFESVTVMIQKEVADRLCCRAGDAGIRRHHGRHVPTMRTRKSAFAVSPANFVPSPKVTSEVIRMNLYGAAPVQCKSKENLFRVIRGAFAKRRKTLANSLAGETSKRTKTEIEAALVSLGYRADIRGEALGLSDFARISDLIEL